MSSDVVSAVTFVAVGSTSNRPDSPVILLAVGGTVIALLIVAWTLTWLRADLRRTPPEPGLAPLRNAKNAHCVTTVLGPLSTEEAHSLVLKALRRAGCAGLTQVSNDTFIGWIGRDFVGRIPIQQNRQGYELRVVIFTPAAGNVEFTCCARPRLRIAVTGSARSFDLANALADRISSEALPQPLA
jgi:hypothetical protein